MFNQWLKDMLDKLPYLFNVEEGSNIRKLFQLTAEELYECKAGLEKIEHFQDIDTAEGATLDRIGLNVRQLRGQASDEIYRILIKSKIARNLSTGDINTIIRVLSITLDVDYEEIRIEELYADEFEPEPAAISLIRVPFAKLNEIGMSAVAFGRIVNTMVAAGVRVSVIDVAGSFQFSESGDLEYGEDSGFGDEVLEIGGFFGDVYQPEDDPEFPV